jgi:hypothetical protein
MRTGSADFGVGRADVFDRGVPFEVPLYECFALALAGVLVGVS